MLELFFNGSRLFTGIISFTAVVMLVLSVINVKDVFGKSSTGKNTLNSIKRIKEVGLFALIVGVLASTIDLMGMFQAVEAASDVSMSVLGGGLKLTFITTFYGLIIYGVSLLISIGLKWKVNSLVS